MKNVENLVSCQINQLAIYFGYGELILLPCFAEKLNFVLHQSIDASGESIDDRIN
jgi:hypothetical protein